MERREFLHKSGAATLAAAALAVKGYAVPWGSLLRRAEADTGLPLASLKAALDPNECILLVPTSANYATYQNAFNLRTALKPQARLLTNSVKGVQQAVNWLRDNKVPFAVRGGGHSYEGFSQSSSVVIDTRLLNKVELDATGDSVFVGGGTALGDMYGVIGKRNLAIPAGSCPTVGVSGHTLGGGFGELSRPFGLACDSLLGVELVNAKGEFVSCSETEKPDLFWALRGGGGGSFGVVTRYHFRTHPVKQLVYFALVWRVPAKRAAAIFQAWQHWVIDSPSEIASLLRFTVDAATGIVDLHIQGQTTGAQSVLQAELKKITLETPGKQDFGTTDFLGSVRHFAGKDGFTYTQTWMKGKSAYVYEPMSDEGILAVMNGMQKHPGMYIIFDGYGGQIAKVAPEATAFFHRKALCSVQLVIQAGNSAAMGPRLATIRDFYDSVKHYFSGYAYINYPDTDLGDKYGTAYWGDNFERLKKIKLSVDPENLFRHAQSIPPAQA
jgi:FAD/FMN-containing dehydrogenase